MGRNFDEFYDKDTLYFGKEPSDGFVSAIEMYAVNTSELTALDIGAGEGRNSNYLAKLGYKVDAIEPTAAGVNKIDSINNKNISTYKGSYTKNFMDKFVSTKLYDVIIAGTSLDHMSYSEILEAVDMIKNSLKPNGIAYIVVFTKDDPGYLKQVNSSECSGHIQHYFGSGELLELFNDCEIIYYKEYIKEDLSHGPTHLHGKAKLILRG